MFIVCYSVRPEKVLVSTGRAHTCQFWDMTWELIYLNSLSDVGLNGLSEQLWDMASEFPRVSKYERKQ